MNNVDKMAKYGILKVILKIERGNNMRKRITLLGFLFAVCSLLVLGSVSTQAFAEKFEVKEIEIEFDLSIKEPQEITYVTEDGKEVVISIEPVEDDTITLNQEHAFPYGSTGNLLLNIICCI
ncbi:hypothetical protein BAZO_18903 [Schinkia azotoformans LMG 9581]|uniref:Uncharacterized protein n=2 Tax=Schinkia azotoformans TaxID=1454 RepID=K6BVY5_SCHAZ|nr:hypothetical protein BAZO_18903 [Schinkia azotoformans LMG 9581]